MLNVLLDRGKAAEAFAIAQKTKARSLLDLLISGRADLSLELTPDERTQQAALRQQADFLNTEMVKEGVQNEVGAKKRFALLREQLRGVELELRTLSESLYSRHPGLADRQIATTATVASLASVLPPDTALLDYIVLSDKKLLLFVVTTQQGKANVKVYTLPAIAAPLQQECADLRAACADPRKDYRPLAARLSRLLVSPASAQLAGKRRLVICPDGPLWNVPFQALTLPKGTSHTSSFLWQRYDLAYAYSATGVQAVLRTHPHEASQETGSLMVMANPDFGSSKRFGDLDDLPGQRPLSDPSRPLSDPSRPLSDPSRPLTDPSRPLLDPSRPLVPPSRTMAAVLEERGGGIAGLPGTQHEAEALHSLFPDAVVFTGAAAQESTAKAEMAKFRYLHFATHGFLNDAAPLLSAIVLAQPDKSDPKASKDDGFLTAREVFDLHLQADLVTLSACNSGRGSIRTGEGVVGLSWAFFVAGVPTQVVSQWSVDDAATAQLMSAFYTHLKAGEGKSQSLREAALRLQKEKGHAHPYYWAPFLLMGDWRH
ncbi:MAG: Regulatory protein AfsR [Chthonomonadaceae bacterium]|nr:Regulatory protein AfsR [Chthonomonadaceae bacterium]